MVCLLEVCLVKMRVLGEKIGDVIEVENPIVEGGLFRDFLRARVLVDITKPLVCGIWIPRPNMEKVWIECRYEKLQVFCFKCGVVGHDFRGCRMKRAMRIDDPGKPRYGAWFGTNPLRSRPILGQKVEDNWRWRTPDEQGKENLARDKACETFENFKARVNVDVREENVNLSAENDKRDVYGKKVFVETSVDYADVEMTHNGLYEAGPSKACFGPEMSEGSGSKKESVVNVANNELVCIRPNSKKFVVKGNVIWDSNGYFVELPPDSKDVVRNSSEVCAMLADGLHKISLKRKLEDDEKEDGTKRRKCDVFLNGEDSFSNGCALQVFDGRKKVKKDKKKILEAVNSWRNKDLVEISVLEGQTSDCWKSPFRFEAGLAVTDANNEVCGWPKTATEAP